MAIDSTSLDSAVGKSSQLFARLDTNQDGKLSAQEFGSFLDELLQQIESRRTSGLGSAAAAGTATRATAGSAVSSVDPGLNPSASASRSYQPMLGFDYTKLNTATHVTPKYVFARATQDVTLGWDRASRSAGLEQIADYVRQHGYANAAVVADDKIDFGDGYGAIDVLTGDGQWWWGPVN